MRGRDRIRGGTRARPQARVLHEFHSDHGDFGLIRISVGDLGHAVCDESGGLPEIRLAHPIPDFNFYAGNLTVHPSEDEGITDLFADQVRGNDLGAAAKGRLRKIEQLESPVYFPLRYYAAAQELIGTCA